MCMLALFIGSMYILLHADFDSIVYDFILFLWSDRLVTSVHIILIVTDFS